MCVEHVKLFKCKGNKQRFTIKWKILAKAKLYSNLTKRCNLCTTEKHFIITKPDLTTLNKRNELISFNSLRNRFILNSICTQDLSRLWKKKLWYISMGGFTIWLFFGGFFCALAVGCTWACVRSRPRRGLFGFLVRRNGKWKHKWRQDTFLKNTYISTCRSSSGWMKKTVKHNFHYATEIRKRALRLVNNRSNSNRSDICTCRRIIIGACQRRANKLRWYELSSE